MTAIDVSFCIKASRDYVLVIIIARPGYKYYLMHVGRIMGCINHASYFEMLAVVLPILPLIFAFD